MKAWRYETSRVAGVPDGFKGMEVMKLESTRGPLNVSLELDASAGGMRSHGLLSRGELGLLLLIDLMREALFFIHDFSLHFAFTLYIFLIYFYFFTHSPFKIRGNQGSEM